MAQRGLGLKLSILVPVFNERSRVEELLDRVLHAPLPPRWMREVLLIDDGSTDGTSELLDALAQGAPLTPEAFGPAAWPDAAGAVDALEGIGRELRPEGP